MARREKFLTSRRLIVASVVFVLFVVFDIALFSYLIFNSLSQRELEKVLLEARAEAEPLARELEKNADELGEDIWVVASVAQETRTYFESVLSQRELVNRIEIRDRNGHMVYSRENRNELPLDEVGGELPRVDVRGSADGLPGLVPESVEVPIGDLGTLVVGLSAEEVQKRIAVLGADLTRQVTLIGGLTVALLGAACAAVWALFRRGRRLEEKALEAERMAYIGTLASGLAHEIRNPLNSLSLNMQMLEEEEPAGASNRRLLAITRSELGRLERLATDFLSYAKPRPLELEDVPAVELLERVASVLAGEAEARGVELVVDDLSAGAYVPVDRGQMGQLLLNLTQNAVAATEDVSRPVVRLVARRAPAAILLEVVDNGRGMTKTEQERMFELFYSTKKGGTGLGLAIVQRIARAHGADLVVESRPETGTVVRVRLGVTPPGGG